MPTDPVQVFHAGTIGDSAVSLKEYQRLAQEMRKLFELALNEELIRPEVLKFLPELQRAEDAHE